METAILFNGYFAEEEVEFRCVAPLARGVRIKVGSFVRRHASARVRVRTSSILDSWRESERIVAELGGCMCSKVERI